jgi:hypothetical protein
MATRIALLLSGYIREPQLASLREFVIDPNIAVGNEISIYVSTWDTYGKITTLDTKDVIFSGSEYWSGAVRSYDSDKIDKIRLESDLRGIAPGDLHIKFNHYEDYAREWLNEGLGRFEFVRGKDEHTILRIKSMWFGMMDVFDMIDPTSYDFMIRSRFDIRFREPVIATASWRFFRKHKSVRIGGNDYSLNGRSEENNAHIARVRGRTPNLAKPRHTLLVPRRDNSYIDDWFAVGTAESIGRHMTTFLRLDEYLTRMYDWPEPFENESITVLNALQTGVSLATFPKTIYQ